MMLKITNAVLYGIDESVKAAGYPMCVDNFSESRAVRLGNADPGSGHDCFLKGIIVQADVLAPQYFWLQWQRYHFHDIISSQSKMHKILQMDIDSQCNKYVDYVVKKHLKTLVDTYNYNLIPGKQKRELFHRIIANCPMGLMLKARISTNYLQLKTIWHQRRTHRLEEWGVYCDWIESLPKFKEYVLSKLKI